MVEVLKRGVVPGDQMFQGTCGNCRSELRAKRSEGKYEFNQREGDFLRVECPVCHYMNACLYPVKAPA